MNPLWLKLQRLIRGNETDSPLVRTLKNSFVLLSGDTGGAVFAALAFFVTARALDPELLGLLVLVQSFASLIDTITNFRCWRIMIKYGADALQSGDRSDFLSVVKVSLLLDVFSSAFGALLTVALAFVLPKYLDAAPEAANMARLYALAVLFHFNGTADGLLRLFDNFLPFAYRSLIVGAGKLLGVSLCWAFGGGPWSFLAVWVGTQILSYVVILGFGWRELLKQGYSVRESMASEAKGIGQRHPGLWRFAIFTHMGSSMRVASRKLDDFIVQKLLGAEALGLYGVAKKFAAILDKAYGPLSKALYPELARSHASAARGTYVRGILGGIALGSAIAVPAFLVFVFFTEQILLLSVGQEYLSAQPLVVPFMAGSCVALIFFGMQSAILSMGLAHVQLASHLFSTIVYFGLMLLLLPAMGLTGIGYAKLGLAVTYAAACGVVLVLRLRKWKEGDAPPDASDRMQASHRARADRTDTPSDSQ